MKSRASVGGHRPRTLQRVSLAKWEQDADLEQGKHAHKEYSVSVCEILRLRLRAKFEILV